MVIDTQDDLQKLCHKSWIILFLPDGGTAKFYYVIQYLWFRRNNLVYIVFQDDEVFKLILETPQLLGLHKFSDFPEPLNKKIWLIETENFDMLNCTILLSGAVFVN